MPFQKHLRSREFDAGIEERCRHILVLTDCSTHSNLRLLGPWSVAGNFLPSVFVTSQKIILNTSIRWKVSHVDRKCLEVKVVNITHVHILHVLKEPKTASLGPTNASMDFPKKYPL